MCVAWRSTPVTSKAHIMDIEFDCDKCGQHIVIDGAGAGVSVPCPKCQAQLMVPQAEPDSKNESVKQPSSGHSPPPPRPDSTATPPLFSQPAANKRKVAGWKICLGASAILILLAVFVTFLSQQASAPSKPIIIHDLEKTPSFTPSAQVEKYAEERHSISNPNYARYMSELYNTSTLMETVRASQRYNQEEANTFIGISEEELIRRLGRPCVIRIAETGEGERYRCLDYGNSTLFNVFEKDGTVWSGYYRNCEFSHR